MIGSGIMTTILRMGKLSSKKVEHSAVHYSPSRFEKHWNAPTMTPTIPFALIGGMLPGFMANPKKLWSTQGPLMWEK